jgi:hypothetical protein
VMRASRPVEVKVNGARSWVGTQPAVSAALVKSKAWTTTLVPD